MRGDPALVYVVSRWGEPTQTFVRREAEAVAAAGVTVSVLSMKRPKPCDSTLAVTWLGPVRLVVGLVRACLAHPREVGGVMVTVGRRAALRNLPSLLLAAAVGVAWAGCGVTRGTRMHTHFGWVAAAAAWSCSTVGGSQFSVVLHAFELHTAKRCDGFTPIPLAAARPVFTISEVDAKLVSDRWAIDAEVLRTGVPRDWLADVRGAAVDPWLVVSVGSLSPKKGHDVLLHALALSDPRWHLLVVGDGPDRELLLELVSTFALSDRVELVGVRSERAVQGILDRAAVFALACRVTDSGDRDGIPVALMEAIARRVPVITTDVSAIRELVDDAGVLVPQCDERALAEALDRLIDPVRRTELGAKGKARVESGFLVEASAERVAELALGARCDDQVGGAES
jgi:colanic acid/amylovoran biosynthesis glycosyltransferase